MVDYYSEHDELFPPKIVNENLDGLSQAAHDNLHEGAHFSRWCGAGHEMVMVDTDGKEYPCHRFSSWITEVDSLPDYFKDDGSWEPRKCRDCIFLTRCPTCVGFNWQQNNDPRIRTMFHCKAFKLQVKASIRLKANKLLKTSNLLKLSPEKIAHEIDIIDSILDLSNSFPD